MSDISKLYLRELSIIKRRYYYLYFRTRPWIGKTIEVDVTRLEECALQMRLMIEGIVLACVHANIAYYGDVFGNLKSDWRLKELLREMKKRDILSFPQPCDYFYDKTGKANLIVRPEKGIDLFEIERIHGIMGNLLHRRYHFFDSSLSGSIIQSIIDTLPDIKEHMNNHVVYLKTDTGLVAWVSKMNIHSKKRCECLEMTLSRI